MWKAAFEPSIRPAFCSGWGLENETISYLAISGVSLTDAQIVTLDTNIKAIKYGSGVTLSSLTANLSLVAAGAFITNPSVDLRPYIGFKHTLTAGGKTAVGWGKAAGTAETYDTELIVNGDCASAEPPGVAWTLTDGSITIHDGEAYFVTTPINQRMSQNIAQTNRALYKTVATCTVLTAGTWHIYHDSGSGADLASVATQSIYTGSATADVWTVGVRARTDTSTFRADNISHKKVLTPSSQGITVVSAQGGATYSWVSDDGLDIQSASFTDTITRA